MKDTLPNSSQLLLCFLTNSIHKYIPQVFPTDPTAMVPRPSVLLLLPLPLWELHRWMRGQDLPSPASPSFADSPSIGYTYGEDLNEKSFYRWLMYVICMYQLSHQPSTLANLDWFQRIPIIGRSPANTKPPWWWLTATCSSHLKIT